MGRLTVKVHLEGKCEIPSPFLNFNKMGWNTFLRSNLIFMYLLTPAHSFSSVVNKYLVSCWKYENLKNISWKLKYAPSEKNLANYMNQRARTSFNNSSVIRRGANMGMPPLTWHHWAVLHIMAEMLGYWVSSLVYQYEIEVFFPILQKFWIIAIYQKKNLFCFIEYLLSFISNIWNLNETRTAQN